MSVVKVKELCVGVLKSFWYILHLLQLQLYNFEIMLHTAVEKITKENCRECDFQIKFWVINAKLCN